MSAASSSPSPRSSASWIPACAVAAAFAAGAVALWRAGQSLDELRTAAAANATTLQQVLGEVTRMRLEQSAGSKGPQALLEKLRTYAPLLASSRTTEPDYLNAKKEMDAILRAFATLGADADKPLRDRLAQLKPEKDFDELKWLLEAAVRVEPTAGLQLLKDVLLGRQLPSPRLRWYAADLLTRHDRPLAQSLLRQVLLTESRNGFNEAHAAAYPGAVIPDKAAMSQSGFNNFVIAYARTDDPKMDETLLMVMGRTADDRVTLQECIKVLGSRRCAAAVPMIEKLYKSPPLQQDDPLFLNYCLEALVDIQGKAARPFLEAALPDATTETVSKRIQFLLNKIINGDLEPKPAPASSTDKDGKPR